MINHQNQYQINMGESLSPWEIDDGQNLKPKINKGKQSRKISTGGNLRVQKDSLTRVKLTTRPQTRSLIKLQSRISTDVFTVEQQRTVGEVQASKIGLRIPTNFKTIPPKRASSRTSRNIALSHRDSIPIRQKTSTLNFLQDIKQLDSLRQRIDRQNMHLTHSNTHRSQGKSNLQSGNNSMIKKCSLNNLNIYDRTHQQRRGGISMNIRGSYQGKRHILDRILSKFQ